jgi:glutamate racemase
MNTNNPIGFFDSGIGGTSIWQAIHELLPFENSVYLADSKNAPYGVRSKEEIIALSVKNTEFLLNQNCKMVVVACNTATTNAIKELRARFKVPFIGIEPAIKPAANQSKTQTIGILATQGTLNSELFNKNVEQFYEIIEQVGHGLVQLIENGEIESQEMTDLLKEYLQPMIDANVDYLVLGCSHYPYLISKIKTLLPKNIEIIDSGEAVARQTKNVLEANNCLNKTTVLPKNIFYTNADTRVLDEILNHKQPVLYRDF